MPVGDAEEWRKRFIRMDERLLARISEIWPSCLATLRGQPEENTITMTLVDVLSRDIVARRIAYFEYQFEPFGYRPDGVVFSKGKVDLAAILDQDRNKYLAYECKRLNVIYSGTTRLLAADYVKDGTMRFVTEQYADGLPLGGMLGYVLNGDTQSAIDGVKKAITKKRARLGLRSGPREIPPIAGLKRFSTGHARPAGSTIELLHTFLPFSASKGELTIGY